MKTILAFVVGIAAGFFFARAESRPPAPPLEVAAPPAPVAGGSVENSRAPLPSPMANPGPRPTWKARIEPTPDAVDKRRCLEGLSDQEIDEWRRQRTPAK